MPALPYLHEAPDMLLFLEEVLIKPAPVGDEPQYLALPEERIFAFLLAPAACAAIGECGQGHNVEPKKTRVRQLMCETLLPHA